jgi:hypothetical protein
MDQLLQQEQVEQERYGHILEVIMLEVGAVVAIIAEQQLELAE